MKEISNALKHSKIQGTSIQCTHNNFIQNKVLTVVDAAVCEDVHGLSSLAPREPSIGETGPAQVDPSQVAHSMVATGPTPVDQVMHSASWISPRTKQLPICVWNSIR